MGGVEKLPDDNGNDVHDNGFITTPDPSQKNIATQEGTSILNVQSVENSVYERENPINTEENMATPSLSALSVRNLPLETDARINTEENILTEDDTLYLDPVLPWIIVKLELLCYDL